MSWLAATTTALAMILAGAGAATAAPPAAAATDGSATEFDDVLVIGGVEYPVSTEVEEYEIVPGADPIDINFGDGGLGRAVWGSSYAKSTEIALLHYKGTAYAAGNIYNAQRIVQVCIWYTRDGVRKSDKVCSTADTVGSTWIGGNVVSTSCWDSLDPDAPRTIFNISTKRIGAV